MKIAVLTDDLLLTVTDVKTFCMFKAHNRVS